HHFPRAAGTNSGASFVKILRTFRDLGKLRLALWFDRERTLGPRPAKRSAATEGKAAAGIAPDYIGQRRRTSMRFDLSAILLLVGVVSFLLTVCSSIEGAMGVV